MVAGRDRLLGCFMGRPPDRGERAWWLAVATGLCGWGTAREDSRGPPSQERWLTRSRALGWGFLWESCSERDPYSTAAWKQPESNPGGGDGVGRAVDALEPLDHCLPGPVCLGNTLSHTHRTQTQSLRSWG